MERFSNAWSIIINMDQTFLEIVWLSLYVSLSATFWAALIGVPFGAALALWKFPLRQFLIILTSSFMALPPVVVGLALYMLLSRSGPFGEWGILFTPRAMIIAQTILILPIIASLTREAVLALKREYDLLFRSMALSWYSELKIYLWDARFGIITALLAGFGRAIAEVGAVIIVGGNINGITRVMTTTIALETSKGNLELALALGIVLISIAIFVNFLLHVLRQIGQSYHETRG